jgi:hypothetical protein
MGILRRRLLGNQQKIYDPKIWILTSIERDDAVAEISHADDLIDTFNKSDRKNIHHYCKKHVLDNMESFENHHSE